MTVSNANNVIRLSMASVGESELDAIREVFTKTVNFGLGIHVQEFEERVKAFCQSDYEVIGVNTGTSALHAALVALDFPAGSEVLVPSITFVASYSAISAAGLKPVSCELLFPSCHIDPIDAATRVTKNTVAIMPVAYAGVDFDRDAIYRLATDNKLRVIEDDAHAFGSLTKNGLKFGSEGDIICFSFDGIKNITCGEGGAILVRDKSLAHKIRVIRSLGIEKDVDLRYKGQRAWDYNVTTQGFRYHMSNINAAIGIAQLTRWPEMQSNKLKLWKAYLDGISTRGLDKKLIPTQKFSETVCMHVFNVILIEGIDRDQVRVQMREQGVETGFHYVPNHLHTKYASNYPLPIAERMGKSLLSLPFHPDLTDADVKRVLIALQNALG